MERAGIDPAAWRPGSGLVDNDATVRAVYRYYGELYLAHPELEWAGMANVVGPLFYAGWQDLYAARHLSDDAERLRYLAQLLDLPELPDWSDVLIDAFGISVNPLTLVGQLAGEELKWFEDRFLRMQREIFEDLAWQHEAYLWGGIEELRRLTSAGELDRATLWAWENIASGDPARVARGNEALLWREQRQVIQDDYDDIRRHHGPAGEAFTDLLTWLAESPFPDGRAYREVLPRIVEVPTFLPPLWLPGPKLRVPAPRGNVADFGNRWEWIRRDMLPAYRRLLADPERMRATVATPVATRVRNFRKLDDLPYPD